MFERQALKVGDIHTALLLRAADELSPFFRMVHQGEADRQAVEEGVLSGPSPLCGGFSPWSSARSALCWGWLTPSVHLVIHAMFSPWQQKARDNRAAQRISKVQLSGDPVRRQQAAPAPLPAAYEPACLEVEGGFKDPLKSKESEQEQKWKLRQVSLAVAAFGTQTHRGASPALLRGCPGNAA